MRNEENQANKARPLLIGVGTMLTSMIAAGFILGYLVDWWLGTMPWFLLGLGVLGFIGGMLKVYKLLTHPGMF
jgi:ATP synthase protein I